MKPLLTLFLILLTLTATCQQYNDTLYFPQGSSVDTVTYNPNASGKTHKHSRAEWFINSGINYSHFANDHGYGSPALGYAGGISDRIRLSTNWYVQPSISYEVKGAKNAAERWRFRTYSVVLEPFIGYRAGWLSLMAAPYYERVLAGANRRMDGDGFSWEGYHWTFWRRSQIGYTLAAEIDMTNASLHFEYSHGISQVRNELRDWTGLADYTLWKSRNELVAVKLVIPFKTFKN